MRKGGRKKEMFPQLAAEPALLRNDEWKTAVEEEEDKELCCCLRLSLSSWFSLGRCSAAMLYSYWNETAIDEEKRVND